MRSDERTSFLSFCSCLLVFSLAWRLLPSLRGEVEGYLLLVVLCGFLVNSLITSGLRGPMGVVLGGLIGAVVALGLVSVSREALGFALVVVLLALALISRRESLQRADSASLMLTALLFQFYMIATSNLPAVWHATARISRGTSTAVSGVIHVPTDLGAYSSGFHLLVLFLCSAVSLTVFRRTRYLVRLVWLAGALAVISVVFVALLARIGGIPTDMPPSSGAWPAGIELVAFGLLCIPLFLGFRSCKELDIGPLPRRQLPAAAGLLLLLLCGSLMAYRPPLTESGRNVLILDPGNLDFSMPVFGRYGDKSGGMFGNLPRFLEANGFVAKRDTLTAENLRWANVLVIINPIEMFTDKHLEGIHGFLSDGGSLLALGDHTGLNAIREPFGQILAPLGIEFNFDSARMLREGWVSCMEFRPHYVTVGVLDENSTQIWTGASLSIRPPAAPVILGKYAFSDKGDRENKDRGYLGDLAPNPGEHLGDVVLVAQSRHGKGKVLVYGDTSTFQNGALVSSYELALRSVVWLAGVDRDLLPRGQRVWLIVLSAAASLALLVLGGRGLLTIAIASAFLAVPTVFWPGISTSGCPMFQTAAEEKIVGIDATHTPVFDLMGWNDLSIGGLSYNLMRNRTLPFLYRKHVPELLRTFDMFIVIGPRSDFDEAELEAIEDYVRNGGVLLVCMGYEEYAAAPSLLESLGFRIDNVPLGPQEGQAFGAPFTLYRGYPVSTDASGAVTLSSVGNLSMLVRRDLGEGAIFVIGDSSFLLNKNLENRDEVMEHNIMFLRSFLASALSRESN